MQLWFFWNGQLHSTNMCFFMDARNVRLPVYNADEKRIDSIIANEFDRADVPVYEDRKTAEFHHRGKKPPRY